MAIRRAGWLTIELIKKNAFDFLATKSNVFEPEMVKAVLAARKDYSDDINAQDYFETVVTPVLRKMYPGQLKADFGFFSWFVGGKDRRPLLLDEHLKFGPINPYEEGWLVLMILHDYEFTLCTLRILPMFAGCLAAC